MSVTLRFSGYVENRIDAEKKSSQDGTKFGFQVETHELAEERIATGSVGGELQNDRI